MVKLEECLFPFIGYSSHRYGGRLSNVINALICIHERQRERERERERVTNINVEHKPVDVIVWLSTIWYPQRWT